MGLRWIRLLFSFDLVKLLNQKLKFYSMICTASLKKLVAKSSDNFCNTVLQYNVRIVHRERFVNSLEEKNLTVV